MFIIGLTTSVALLKTYLLCTAMSNKCEQNSIVITEFMQALKPYIRTGHIGTNDKALKLNLINWAKTVCTQIFEYLLKYSRNV